MARAYRTFRRISSVFLLAGVTIAAAPAMGAPPKKAAPKAAPMTAEQEETKEAWKLGSEAQQALEKKRYDEAHALAQKALAKWEKLKPDSDQVSMVLLILAQIHEQQKQFARAVPYRERILRITEKTKKDGAYERIRDVKQLALLLQSAGEHARSLATYERAMTLALQHDRGTERDEVISVLGGMSAPLKSLRRYDEAEATLLRAIKACENVTRDRKPYAYLLVNLGKLYHETGQYTKAEPVRAHAVERVADVGGFRFNATDEMGHLAQTRVALQDYAGAEVVLDEIVGIAKEREGEDSISFAIALMMRAVLDVETGAYDQAEPRLLRAQAILDKKGSDAPGLRVVMESIFGRIAAQKGDYARGEALLLRALAHYEKEKGPKDKSVAESAANLADL
jgi:tetratricopeptide (TPR) repeat protein